MKYSIITPTFNSAGTIEATFKSLHMQSVPFQHIIIDGCSTDDTMSICKRYLRDDDILISEPDDGIYDAMNKGIGLANGEIIGILNSDDIYSDNTVLQRIGTHMQNRDMLYGSIDYIDKFGSQRRKFLSSRYPGHGAFYRGWHPPHPAFFVKRHCYEKGGLFDTSFKIAADFELMLRFFENEKFSETHLNDILVHMRDDGISASLSGRLRGMADIRRAFKKNGKNPPFLYFIRRYSKKYLEKFI